VLFGIVVSIAFLDITLEYYDLMCSCALAGGDVSISLQI
jgi:hypothetical protein